MENEKEPEMQQNSYEQPQYSVAESQQPTSTSAVPAKNSNNKFWLGFFSALIATVITFVVGMIIYKDDDEKFRTFMKGWAIGFAISLVLSIICFVIFCSALAQIPLPEGYPYQ